MTGSGISRPNLLRADDRFQFRDRRPRYLPVRSRGGVGTNITPGRSRGQWHPRPVSGQSMVGRTRRTETGTPVPGARTHHPAERRRGRGLAATLSRHAPIPSALGLFVLAVALALTLVACSGAAGRRRSTRPGRARPTAVPPAPTRTSRRSCPKTYRGDAPETLDSGRNCTADEPRLARDAGITEVRFAGGTWTFGAERAAGPGGLPDHGPRRRRPGRVLHRRARRAAARTEITGAVGSRDRRPAGSTGSTRRPASGVQTVVVWPAAAEDVGQRGHHQRPARRPDPGRDRRVRRPVMLRFAAPPRAGPARSAAGRSRRCGSGTWRCSPTGRGRIPVVDRNLRRGAGARPRQAGSVVAGRAGGASRPTGAAPGRRPPRARALHARPADA